MTINEEGLALLKSFEQCKLKSYQDSGGIWTVGWGHTGPEVCGGMSISQDQADSLLLKDLTIAEAAANKYLRVPVNSNQFSALVCFTFNVGTQNFKQSTLLNCINKNNAKQAADEFLRWIKVKGVISKGLTRRREAERALFIKS